MPTLVREEMELGGEGGELSDASSTIIHDESLLRGFIASKSESRNRSNQPVEVGGRETRSGEGNMTLDDSVTILSRTLLYGGLSPVSCRDNDSTLIDVQNFNGLATPSKFSRTAYQLDAMPNMKRYQSTYQSYVKGTISEFATQFPGRLRDYRSMSDEQKLNEQQRVMELLARLGISKEDKVRNCFEKGRREMDERGEFLFQSPGHFENDGSISPILSPASKSNKRFTGNKNFTQEFIMSSKSLEEEIQIGAGLVQSVPNDTSNFSVESVELVRAEEVDSPLEKYSESPVRRDSIPHKRSASTSGKRGADVARFKRSNDMSPDGFDNNNDSEIEISPYRQLDMLSMTSPPPDQGEIFTASQSPISPRLAYDDSDGEENRCLNDSFRSVLVLEEQEAKSSRDSVYSFRTNNRGCVKTLREAPTNVALKNGATLFFDPLDTKRNERIFPSRANMQNENRRLVNFPDPFLSYGGREKVRLQTALEWIQSLHSRMENEQTCSPSGTIFALPQHQIMDLTLKLLQDDDRGEFRDLANGGQFDGQTAIVARAKEDLFTWERALRENTACSVLNHATLPSEDRKRISTAKRCAFFNVVLTTFDAIKSPDIATPIDDFGHAISSNLASESGWIQSRTSSQSRSGPQICKQLSVLHQLRFKRVIFVDFLGRKCFLAKKNTARALASVALNAEERYVLLFNNLHPFFSIVLLHFLPC